MKIKAVELMRRLREQISEETEGMTLAERCEYYEEGSRAFQSWLQEARKKDAHSSESGRYPLPIPRGKAITASGNERVNRHAT